MPRRISPVAAAVCAILAGPALRAADAAVLASPAPPAKPKVEVFLKDGSQVIGTLDSMTENKLKVDTAFAKTVEIDWAEVVALTTDTPASFVLSDGSTIKAQAVRTAQGGIELRPAGLNPLPVTHDQIVAINPPAKPAMTFKGFLAASAAVNDGNTHNRAATLSGEFSARSERQRFTVSGIYNYADDNNHVLSARNWRGNIEYDFYLTKRLYLFAAALFQNDKFQDLRLRTALSAGPGFQVIDKGYFKQSWLSQLEVRASAGLAFFDEDFYRAKDRSYLAARWALNVLWPIIPDKIILFHNHEGFPSLENRKDLVILTEQGVRLSILKNLFAAFQLNWRWTNNPPDELRRADTTFLFSLGYNFDLTS